MIQALYLVILSDITIGEGVIWTDGRVTMRIKGVNRELSSLEELQDIMKEQKGEVRFQNISEELNATREAVKTLASLLSRESPSLEEINRKMLEK
jgi:hypothetical protein